MEIALIRNFLLAMIAIVNPLGKIPIWVEASEGCDRPVRTRLALLVTGTATLLLLVFLFFGQAILDFLGLDIPSFRVGGGIIILLIGIDVLRGRAVDVDTNKRVKGGDALDQAKARFRDIVVPVAIPILAGPGSITTASTRPADSRPLGVARTQCSDADLGTAFNRNRRAAHFGWAR